MKYRVGDHIAVIAGRDKGKTGNIVKILEKTDLVLIENVNQRIKHVKARQNVPGERTEFFAPIHISNIAILDPKTKKPSRVGYKLDANGQKVRISKSSGEVILVSNRKAEKKLVPTKNDPLKIKA